MKIKLTNTYNNTALPGSGFKPGYGNAFVIDAGKERLLYDTGWQGDILMHNLGLLGVKPDSVTKLIFSHGHFDHTSGLEKFLTLRKLKKALPVYAHPDTANRKKAKSILGLLGRIKLGVKEIGFPEIPEQLKKKIKFNYVTEPVEVTAKVFTLGEVTDRPEKDATAYMMQMRGGKWGKDLLLDDLSIAIHTKKGMVLVCGCCHAGLLNTMKKASALWPKKKITAVVGGTHMMMFKKKELDYICAELETKYGSPDLYLNHCSGEKSMNYISGYFPKGKVLPFHAGESLTFDC